MHKKILLLPLLIIVILFGSCKTQRLGYFQDLEKLQAASFTVNTAPLQIKPGDELMINVTAQIPEAVAIYNLPVNNPALVSEGTLNLTTTRQLTYTVSPEGTIDMPVIGKLKVEGMTTRQLAEDLTRKIAENVEGPHVRVQLVNFKVKVIGEVGKPGAYTIDKERVSVIDALAEAGDLTVFARRDNIVVMREENGKMTYHHLDLTDSKCIESPYFYLQQNDVVYAEPGSARSGQAEYNQNNAYKVSVVSAIVSGCSVVASLIIALVVNK